MLGRIEIRFVSTVSPDNAQESWQLDREVRRFQADERAQAAAQAGTYGTVKLLRDTNGDGVMDAAEVFADHLPPAYGICPARGGIIGERVFRDNCATCHQAHGLGFAVGPDLGAEFQRAEEAILKDILAPNETISAGYPTYVIETAAGLTLNGILASESAISITLRLAAGAEQVVLRKDIARFESMSVSLMPEALATTLEPKDVADVITFLRDRGENQQSAATNRIVLFDEEAEFITRLGEGDGRATFETNGAFSGYAFFALTPPQRYSGSIPGWNFHITEKRRRRRVSLPAPGVENPGRAGRCSNWPTTDAGPRLKARSAATSRVRI